MIKIRPTVQALASLTYIHTYSITRTTFSYSRGLNMSKSPRTMFSQSHTLSYYVLYMEVQKSYKSLPYALRRWRERDLILTNTFNDISAREFDLPSPVSGISVGIVTGYGIDNGCSIPGRGKWFFSSPQRPDRLWDPPSLLSNGYRGFFSRG
jgi:hypothetical protein